jgi:DNA-binding MarR family transcriptional regulator
MRCLCATVRRASRLLNRKYEEALRPAGVGTSQFELMMTLKVAGASDQSRLARLLETDQTTLSRNLRLLLDERWIERKQNAQDARRQVYCLTALGLTVLSEAQRCWHQAHEAMERQIGAPMSELWPMLDRILQAAREPVQTV